MRGRDVQEDMVKIISDKDGKQLVLINDIKFKTRRTIDWKMVESYLKEYIVILSILVYTLFSRMFDLMQPPAVKHSIAVV